ncbi:FCP1 homology domain-containing protein [Plasmodiophora brassicae]|nr:hypothetical protein PBRA_004029 [Plasmodiophora brassicae]
MQALAIDCSGGRESPVDSDGTESIIDGLDEDCLLLAKIDDRLQPVILFDWDDTLLASTDLSFYGYRIDSDERFAGPVEEALRALEASVLELLDLALESGQVYIVTNSEAGWVEMSARRFLPSVVRLLDKITVISARSIYERDFPGCPSAWKLQAFMQMTDLFRGRTVVSLGDSYVEREAIYAATSVTYDSRTVSVKFLERPSLAQLRIQIDLIKQAHLWTYLCDPETDLDLMLVTDPQASSANFIVASTV